MSNWNTNGSKFGPADSVEADVVRLVKNNNVQNNGQKTLDACQGNLTDTGIGVPFDGELSPSPSMIR